MLNIFIILHIILSVCPFFFYSNVFCVFRYLKYHVGVMKTSSFEIILLNWHQHYLFMCAFPFFYQTVDCLIFSQWPSNWIWTFCLEHIGCILPFWSSFHFRQKVKGITGITVIYRDSCSFESNSLQKGMWNLGLKESVM